MSHTFKVIFFFLLLLILAGTAQAGARDFSGAFAHPTLPASDPTPALGAAAGQAGSGHSVHLTWIPSTSSCLAPCVLGYNVFRGNTTGGESSTPLNPVPIVGTAYDDLTVTLGANPISYFYTVEAVETTGGVTVASVPSNEASATFPGIPAAPSTLGATPH